MYGVLLGLAVLAGGFDLRESATELTIRTAQYEVAVSREGFGLQVRRQGQVVFETAQPGNLAFEKNGRRETVGKMTSFERRGDVVALEYATSFQGATARVELRPGDDVLRVATWLLHSEGDLVPSLRFRLSPSGLWYGGGFQGWRDPQTFPLNEARISKNGFLANGNTQGTPAWYSTKGIAVWLRTPHDFAYSVNRKVDGKDDGLFSVEMPGVSSLSYDILVGANIREVVDRINREIGLPRSTPPADYFKLPIYTTWVEHKTEVSQAKVLEFARAIRDNKLPCGVIEIDDKWESRYGDMTFDKAKFPDPKAMTDELHRMGYRVTLWVHPFVNVDSETYANARYQPLLLRDLNGRPGLMKWWQGVATAWDFSDPKAAAEFRSRLVRLQKEDGFDGFKFDGGDVNLLPRDLRSAGGITAFDYPDIYNREATAQFEWEETRVGVYSQPLGIVQRLIDKHSTWGKDNGMAAILPEAITVSMRGFAYLMPDMVGGNQYDNDKITKELLVRWAQASALMPLLQFSVGPWHFDEEAVRLCREASELHVRFAPYIVELARAVPKTGEPILRPIWYNEPADQAAFAITDEFMLGRDVVVAPVLEQGATSRRVYLPGGKWKELKTGKTLDGARWIDSYPAPLDTLPVFVREGSRAAAL